MKKKILFVPSWYPGEKDPISGVFIQEQAIALSERYDVAVLIPEMAAWRNVFNPETRERSSRMTEEGLPVYREFARPLPPHGPEIVDYRTFSRAAEHGFKKILLEWGRPDIIHTHVVLPAGWAALKLSQRYSIPLVLTEHSSPFSMHLDTSLKRRLVRETLTNADSVIAISPALKDQLLAFEPALEVTVIGEAVRTDFFVPASEVGERKTVTRFFAVGRLSEQKGMVHLIDAVQLLKQRGVDSFEVAIGGDGPDRDKLERQVKELNLEDRVQFLGALDRAQVKREMQKCNVFVLPSLHETFGVVVGEAMACGKPVIVTRCGGPEFVVTDETGVLVDVASPEGLAYAMTEFLARLDRYDPLVIRESLVSRFGPLAFVNNVSTVYRNLLERVPAGAQVR